MWSDYREEVQAAQQKAADRPTASANTTVELAADLLGQIPGALKKILGDGGKDSEKK
jgi:hypothetical protein